MLYPINLDKERNLKFGMRALDQAEKRTGIPVMAMDINDLTMNQIATLVWCGLTHEDKNLTVGNVMDLIDDYSNLASVLAVVGPAINEAIAGKSVAEEAPDKAVDEEKN